MDETQLANQFTEITALGCREIYHPRSPWTTDWRGTDGAVARDDAPMGEDDLVPRILLVCPKHGVRELPPITELTLGAVTGCPPGIPQIRERAGLGE